MYICIYDRTPRAPLLKPSPPRPPCGEGRGLGDQTPLISLRFPCVVKSLLLLEQRFSPELPRVQSQNQLFSDGFLHISKCGGGIDALGFRITDFLYVLERQSSEPLVFLMS